MNEKTKITVLTVYHQCLHTRICKVEVVSTLDLITLVVDLTTCMNTLYSAFDNNVTLMLYKMYTYILNKYVHIN